MKKVLIGIALIAGLLTVLLVMFKNPVLEALKDVITANTFVEQDNDNFDPGVDVGDSFPTIDASYRGRKITDISEYSGQRGTIFVVSRSVVWCPYCMKQMIQLNENLGEFQKQGWSLVGLTYDSVADQQPFKDKYEIDYPILSDNNAASVIKLGILNKDYVEGDEAYGIGHPGAFIMDNNGKIIGKLFLESYAKRVDAKSLLKIANELSTTTSHSSESGILRTPLSR